MSDVAAKEVESFWAQLERFDARNAAFLLHLSEGYDPVAHAHFEALRRGTGWAIDRALAEIHCVALTPADLVILQQNGGSMVWSPFSNLLLYGRTANVAAAKKAKLRIELGCDWSPSGSKNHLAEMKVAAIYRDPDTNRRVFTDKEIVAMVTRTAAEILRWDGQLGTIAPGRIADLTVLRPRATDAYDSAVAAREADVRLVVAGGIARYGHRDLMHALVTPDRDV
jgi:5-methylthioadenosine/S-adenosylhomocysteine deaminase